MLKVLSKIFGSKSDKDIKKLQPVVKEINAEFDKLQGLTHDELRQRTEDIKLAIDGELKDIDDKLAALHKEVDDSPEMDVYEKEERFDEIDKLEEKRNEQLEKVLLKVLPQGFAVVKETARRFRENEELEVTVTDHDRMMSAKKDHVEIRGEKAFWKNSWTAAGSLMKWDMVHYDVQLIGGMVLHEGKIAEMATGEGKTLVATLPAFLNALARRGVHVVTVNDYLARRDSEWMAPLFEFHGMTVDCIDKHEPHSEERKAAYRSDICYGTNNEFGFDYLRDNMSTRPDELVQRRHHYAMVDEVDSVLVDEARTPLIISGPVPRGDEHEYYELKPRINRLVEEQKKLVGQYMVKAKKLLKEDPNSEEGGLALFRVHRALPKYKPLIKFLSETGIRQILQRTENYYLAEKEKHMPEADEPLFFTIEEKQNSVNLTDKGINLITGEGEDPSFFIMPDIGEVIAGIEKDESLSEDAVVEKKEEVMKDYSIKAQRIHSVNQLLKAYTLFEKDTEYIIVDGKVKIVDEQTGRVMEGRRYSDGLHQSIEAKENVKVEDATQTYATITLQNYFRMYHKLSGMTGTAVTEAGEFWEIYKLDVVTIPTNRPIVRDDRQDLVYKTMREKFNSVVEEIVSLTKEGRPVLVGTTSVEISELLSRMLNLQKIGHNVLNAKQHQKEAEIVAIAGTPGTVTIATNMAGRGTDIKLTPESKEAGGLAIIGTERHESRRVDRQLRGRSGRQGDPGSTQFFVSLEDNLMRMFMPERIAKIMDRLGLKEGEVISHSMVTKSIERAQKKVEENNFGIRKRLLEYDDVMNSQREVIYKRRKNALFGERLQMDILNMILETCEDLAINAKMSESYDSFKLNIITILGFDFDIDASEFETISESDLGQKLFEAAMEYYENKNQKIADRAFPVIKMTHETRGATVKNILVPFTDGKIQLGVPANLEKCVETKNRELVSEMEKIVTLRTIDRLWKEHLREMDDLKQSVQMAVHEQKDPLLIYKFEGFELFKQFIAKVNEETVAFLMKADIPVNDPDEVKEAQSARQRSQNLKEQKDESKSILQGGGSPENRPPVQKTAPVKSQKTVGRNERVTVQYSDGRVMKDVKYKKVEEDIRNNKCILVEE